MRTLLCLLLLPALANSQEPTPRVVGHRGLMHSAPENTLAGFSECLKRRVGFELDIRRTKDGVLVCLHDADLERTTDGQGKLKSLTLVEARKLDAGSKFGKAFAGARIPTLEEVFALIKKHGFPGLLVALDIKDDDETLEGDIVALAKKMDVMDRIVCIGRAIVEPEVRKKLRAADAKTPIAVLAPKADDLPTALADPHADWIYLRFVPSAEQVAQIRKASKKIFLSGALVAGHDPVVWALARKASVDALLTDYPLECVAEFRRPPAAIRLGRFSVDVTPPIGHASMGGGISPIKKIDDPLYAHGFVLVSEQKPIVVVAVDWCEIRNDAYERWRSVIAEAVHTDKNRVLVTALHQHDAPIADLTAQKLLDAAKAKGNICDLAFHEKTVQRVAKAVRESLKDLQLVTHIGVGEAKVQEVASNRRYLDDQGTVRFNRMSRTGDPKIRAFPEGVIDPWLKTFSFWNGAQPILAMSAYAVHPMSYYGGGGASSDFVGLARKLRQADAPEVLQLYVSGCSGNVTAGKWNDGAPANRAVLADKLYQAMKEAWKNTKRHPLSTFEFRAAVLKLEPRTSAGFSVEELKKKLHEEPRASDKLGFQQCLAALGLSWRERLEAGLAIDVPALDFGPAQLVLLPAESYVEYQLLAQKLRPESFVVVMGYGECAPGYIPTEQAFAEKDGNLHDWCWIAPGSQARMTEALTRVLQKK